MTTQEFTMQATIVVCAMLAVVGVAWLAWMFYVEIRSTLAEMRPNERRTLFMVLVALAAVVFGLIVFARGGR